MPMAWICRLKSTSEWAPVRRAALAAMQAAGAEHTVVLRGNAVSYAVVGQGAPGLTIGGWKQTQAPRMDNDVIDLIKKHKIPVFVIEEDLAVRGIERGELGEDRGLVVTGGARVDALFAVDGAQGGREGRGDIPVGRRDGLAIVVGVKDNRVLGFCGSSSRMIRRTSANSACLSRFLSSGVLPVSNSYRTTPSE